MHKLAFATAAALLVLGAPAMAGQAWNVTEERASGIKDAQGTWDVNVAGEKLTGSATMQLQNGNPLTYTLDGSVAGGVYTVKLDKRSDDKKNCVWTGHTPSGPGTQTHGLIGEATCDGVKLIIRVGM